MDRALVVLEESEAHRDLLREAGELAAGVDAELVLLSTITRAEFEEGVETIETIADMENTGYSGNAPLDAAENVAQSFADDELDGIEVDYTAVGTVHEEGEEAHEILSVAENRDCDYVFLVGRRRSPTGKALFGDTAQSVILNFDGRVTIATA